MIRMRRRRRASLRGWWRTLPFVLLIGVELITFAALQTGRLRNEYRANELAREIERVHDRIGLLRGAGYDLGRLERMDAAAPKHALIEPRAGQVKILKITPEQIASLGRERIELSEPVRMTRTAIIRIDGASRVEQSAAPDTAVAQRPAPDPASPATQF